LGHPAYLYGQHSRIDGRAPVQAVPASLLKSRQQMPCFNIVFAGVPGFDHQNSCAHAENPLGESSVKHIKPLVASCRTLFFLVTLYNIEMIYANKQG
jgi:hypothetical protein